jgi:hypothetical protein
MVAPHLKGVNHTGVFDVCIFISQTCGGGRGAGLLLLQYVFSQNAPVTAHMAELCKPCG